MTTNERRFQVTVHYKANDNGIIADGMNGTTTATAEQAANWIITFAEENSNYTVTEFNIRDCETFKKYRSNDADLQALVRENVETKAEVKAIETKIAANGAKLYYRVDENGNKTRVAYKDCYMELAWQAHDNYEAECEANRKAQIDVIDDYANPDAFEVAVNAEIQAANNEQNDEAIEAEFTAAQNEVYRLQDEMNALIGTPDYFVTQNEYHAAWQRYELALAKAQQASRRRMTALLNTEPDTTPQVDPIIIERDTARNEYEEINQVRRLIEKDCERYERLRDRCKPNSPKHKEYKQLLADFDPIIRAFGEKFIAALDRYNQSLTLRTDEEKAATQKAIDEHNKDLDARGIKYFATVYYYPNGVEGEDMETFHKDCTSLDEANAFVSQEDHDGVYVGGIYDAGWEITDRNDNLVANHITGIKEEQPMTIEIPAEGTHEFTIGDDTVCFFNGKFHSVFSAKYHMAIVRDLVGCFSYCIYNDGDTEVFNVREHAVSYDNFMETLHQRGNREKLLALRKDYIITDRLSENNSSLWYVNGKRSSHIKVYNLLQTYGLTLAEFLAEDEAYINECIAASCKQIAIKDQADFLADKIKRDAQPSDDNVFDLLPDLDNDVEKVWLTKGELDDLTEKFRDAVSIIPVTTRIEKMLPATITITKQNRTKTFDMGFGAFAKYSIVQWRTGLRIMRNVSTLGIYDTPAQVEKVIDLLKAAISRGDKAFTFPTVEELKPNPDGKTIFNHQQKKNLRDSLNRAIKQCIRNRIGYLKSHNSKMEKYEYELMHLLQGARRELGVA